MTFPANLVALARRSVLGVGPIVTLTAEGRLPVSNGWDFVAEDQKPTGTHGGTSIAGVQVRTLNTVILNKIGATLASNVVTLPAGTYEIEWDATSSVVAGHTTQLRNVSTGVVIAQGVTQYMAAGGGQYGSISPGRAEVTFATATQIQLEHYTQTAVATIGLGQSGAASGVSIYARLRARKLS